MGLEVLDSNKDTRLLTAVFITTVKWIIVDASEVVLWY
jgi:hypothetical protein